MGSYSSALRKLLCSLCVLLVMAAPAPSAGLGQELHRSTGFCNLIGKHAMQDVGQAEALLLAQSHASSPGGGYAESRGSRCFSSKEDLFTNPFSADSAHHRPIGTGAVYAETNNPATRNWLQAANSIGLNVGAPFGVNVYKVTDADAEIHVQAKAGCHSRDLPASIKFPAGRIMVPANYRQPCGDGMVVIVNESSWRADEIRGYDWNGGSPVGQNHWQWDVGGLGHGTRAGDRVGSTATGVAALFGVLRGEEINTPARPIEHALQIALPWGKAGCPAMLAPSFASPAVSMDGNAGKYGVGNIPYGALLALPPVSAGGPELESLGLSESGMRLAQALRGYGAYAVDSTHCPNIRTDQHVRNTAQLKNELEKLYPYVRMVLNGDWRSGEEAVGGGTPLAPNCAYDAR